MATARHMRGRVASARGAATPPPVAAPAPAARPAVRPRQVTEEVGRGQVTTSLKERGVVYDETDREVEANRVRFEEGEHPAYVKVGGGLTISIGQFEFLRVDCSVSLPCHPDQIDETYEIASQFVADRVAEEQARWLPEGAKKGGR